MTSSARTLAVVALATLSAAGCAGGGAGGRGPAVHPSATVSAADYRNAVSLFLNCMKSGGYRVAGPVLSPLDQRMLLRDVVPPRDGQPAKFNSRLAACDREANLGYVEPAYLATHPPSLHPSLRDDAVACLRRQGVAARGGETNYGDYVHQAKVSEDFNQCLTAIAKATFPDLPAVITIFY